jgi:hypothetical protein
VRSAHLLLLGATAASALTGVALAEGAFSQASPATLDKLRVCTYESFSRSQARCSKDRRADVLRSNRFACSADVLLRRPARVHARMTYRGQLQYAYTTRLLAPGPSHWWIATNIKMNQPLPGGTWGCDFSVGRTRLAAAFRSGGPTGPVVDLAVCPVTEALQTGPLLICSSDRSASIRSNDPIICNGVYVGQRGKTDRIDLLSGQAMLAAGRAGYVDAPVWIAYQQFSAQPAGDYSCGFSVDGTRLAEKPFRVAG